MAQASIFEQVLDYSNRANPYPLYAELRRTPVSRQADGSYVVSTYRLIAALLHDPRLSSDPRDPADKAASGVQPGLLHLDPPDHDRIRRLAMRHFGPPHTPGRIDGMQAELTETVTSLIDAFPARHRVDIVDDFAYPFPVAVICKLLGVPREDEPRFSRWVDVLVQALDPRGNLRDQDPVRVRAVGEFNDYLGGLIEAHRRRPGDDMLSALATDDGPQGRLSDDELRITAVLLLTAGHETTVNLIAHGMLTLLRRPDVLRRLRQEPDLIVRAVEELVRYEPSVQFIPWRWATCDMDVAGTTIPQGSLVTLVLAAGNRDPEQFSDPERFDPDREEEHLGFGGGIHYCFGAPLARLETQIALTELARRLENPRLVTDPPPYRPSPVLRGPAHLLVDFDDVLPASAAVVPAAAESMVRPRTPTEGVRA
jgi:cytochrome P450